MSEEDIPKEELSASREDIGDDEPAEHKDKDTASLESSVRKMTEEESEAREESTVAMEEEGEESSTIDVLTSSGGKGEIQIVRTFIKPVSGEEDTSGNKNETSSLENDPPGKYNINKPNKSDADEDSDRNNQEEKDEYDHDEYDYEDEDDDSFKGKGRIHLLFLLFKRLHPPTQHPQLDGLVH